MKRTLALLVSGLLAQGDAVAQTSGQTATAADRQYRAQWIWCKVASPEPFQFVRFRKTVELAAFPEQATAYITADTFYRLWINEQLVMHGPARSSFDKAMVDPVNVGRYLKQGTNSLMIEALHGCGPFEAMAKAPGMLCQVEATLGGKRTILAATDATWEASEITAWSRKSLRFTFMRGWMEDYDARLVLQEKVAPATVLGKVGMPPWTKVELRDVPLPAPLVEIRPASILAVQRGDGFAGDFMWDTRVNSREEWDSRAGWFRRLQTERLKADPSAATNAQALTKAGQGDAVMHGEGTSITCEFERGYVGFIGFEVTGKAGEEIEIAWHDRPADDGDVRPCAQTGRNGFHYTLREGRQSFLCFNPQFARFLRIAHRGAGDVTVHRLGITEFRFVAEPKGDFACSDEGINQVYEAARWTAALNTLDAFMDCPHRERNAMQGVEAYWMLKAVYPLFGDTSVSRRSILWGADGVEDPQGKTFGPPGMVQIAYPMYLPAFGFIIPNVPLFWVLQAGLYERCSGDTQLIRDMIPVMRRNLAAFDRWRDSDGLIESYPNPDLALFFDWAEIRKDGVSVALNGVYARTLDEAARLERLAGDAQHAADFDKLARQVRSSLNRLCTNDTFYPDVLVRNPQASLVPSRETSETTQYYAMWGGIPSPDRERRMWQALRDDFLPTPLQRLQPIRGLSRGGLYTFLERLELAARHGDHAALLRDAKAMFLPMVQNAPGTLWEGPASGMRPEAQRGLALCHSIGCGVAGILTEEVLGIRLGFPLKIAPHSGGALRSCHGFMTTPKGRVQVAWDSQKDRYHLQLSLPAGVTAEVVLPPEAKAIWHSAPAADSWPDTLNLAGAVTVEVAPGRVKVE